MAERMMIVVDPEGNEHEMTYLNGWDMITHVKGWKRKPAGEVKVVAVPAPEAPPPPSAEPVSDSPPAEPEDVDPDDDNTVNVGPEVVDLGGMTKNELITFAKANIGIDLDLRWGKPRMIAAIQAALSTAG